MVGDAPGDQSAAKKEGAPFLPINPGKEERSREPPHGEAFNRFFEGTCAGISSSR